MVSAMYREEKIFAFYRGFTATLLGSPATWCIYFPVYNYTKGKLQSHMRTEYASMAGSAVTAIMVNLIVSPCWVAKTRMQT